jgi:hypothetical protein
MATYRIHIGPVAHFPTGVEERCFVTAWQEGTQKVLTTKFATWKVLDHEFVKYKVRIPGLGSFEQANKESGEGLCNLLTD